jgi:uridylate kinase
LRALEIQAELFAKATRVDGVYDRDPKKHADAVLFEEVSYSDVLARNLAVMDASAVAMCRDNKLPIRVFNLNSARQYNADVDGRARRHANSSVGELHLTEG